MYEKELENVSEFGGFQELLHTYDLLRGKKVDDEENDSLRVTGKFKVRAAQYIT